MYFSNRGTHRTLADVRHHEVSETTVLNQIINKEYNV